MIGDYFQYKSQIGIDIIRNIAYELVLLSIILAHYTVGCSS